MNKEMTIEEQATVEEDEAYIAWVMLVHPEWLDTANTIY